MLKFVFWDETSYSPVEYTGVSVGRVVTAAHLSCLSCSENCDRAFLQNVDKHVPNPQQSVDLLFRESRISYCTFVCINFNTVLFNVL
jgi:predicted transcriptional regulator YheO